MVDKTLSLGTPRVSRATTAAPRVSRHRPGWPGQQCQARGPNPAQHYASMFFDYIFKNWYKLQKCVENAIRLGKI
jgi:hypothetical protein